MLQPKPNGFEITRVLELMGLTQHHRVGPHRVFLNRELGERVVCLEEQWDMSPQDINDFLVSNNLSQDDFWEKYNSLFS